MACPKKTKQLTLLHFHSKKLKLAEAEDDSKSHSDLEVEDESLDEQDFSETESDSFLPTTSNRRQDNYITVQYPSAPTTIIINDFSEDSDHRNVAQDQQNFRVSPACTSESSTSQVPCDIAQGLHQQPAQPVIKFPTTKIGSKNGLLTLHGMQNISGLSTQLSRIQLFVTRVDFLPTLLVDHLKHLLK